MAEGIFRNQTCPLHVRDFCARLCTLFLTHVCLTQQIHTVTECFFMAEIDANDAQTLFETHDQKCTKNFLLTSIELFMKIYQEFGEASMRFLIFCNALSSIILSIILNWKSKIGSHYHKVRLHFGLMFSSKTAEHFLDHVC